MDIIKAAKCNMLAKKLRKCIEPGDTMSPLWDAIFDLEAMGRGKPEQAIVHKTSPDWHIKHAERILEGCEDKA